jgi:two-component system cell cycle response regulator CtrA
MSAGRLTLHQHAEAENDRLRDRIDELEGVLGQDDEVIFRIRLVLGLTTTQAKFMSLLLRREAVTYEQAFTVLYGTRPENEQPGDNMISILVCHCRRKLKRFGVTIETVWGEGHHLTAANKKIINDLIARWVAA